MGCFSSRRKWRIGLIWRNEFIFRLDRYDDYRNYWLTVSNGDGRSIGVFQSAKGALDTLDSFDDRIMYKLSLEQPTNDEDKIGGLEWIWAKLSSRNSSFSLNLNLSQPVKSSDVFIKVTTQPPTAGGSFNISLRILAIVNQVNTILSTISVMVISE